MSTVRTFVSIAVPDKTSLSGILSEVSSIENVRASPLSQMHITLKFIGDVDERKVPKVVESVRAACRGHSPFRISLEGTGCFPDMRRPSVIWVGAGPKDGLTLLSDDIGKRLSAAGIAFDDKPFKAHITIGRCKGPTKVSDFISSHADDCFTEFECTEILVMKSVLSPSGAKHSVIERIPLDAL